MTRNENVGSTWGGGKWTIGCNVFAVLAYLLVRMIRRVKR